MRYMFSEAQLEFLINALSIPQSEVENLIDSIVGDMALQGAIKNNLLYIFAPQMRVWKHILYITAPNIRTLNNKLIIS